jgi:hypothetical protein
LRFQPSATLGSVSLSNWALRIGVSAALLIPVCAALYMLLPPAAGQANEARDRREIRKYINESSLRDPAGFSPLGEVKDFRIFDLSGDTYRVEAEVNRGSDTPGRVTGHVRVTQEGGERLYEFHLDYEGVPPLRSDNSSMQVPD